MAGYKSDHRAWAQHTACSVLMGARWPDSGKLALFSGSKQLELQGWIQEKSAKIVAKFAKRELLRTKLVTSRPCMPC